MDCKNLYPYDYWLWVFSRMSVCCCQRVIKRALNRRSEARHADKDVITSAVFTKCWPKPRLKVKLLNHDGLRALNCRHHLTINEAHSEERRSSVQTEDNRRGRRGLKTQRDTAAAFRLWQDGALSRLVLPALPFRLHICQSDRDSLRV